VQADYRFMRCDTKRHRGHEPPAALIHGVAFHDDSLVPNIDIDMLYDIIF
jgi:hypothetical protein